MSLWSTEFSAMTLAKETCTTGMRPLNRPSHPADYPRQAVTPKLLWEALKDYDMWLIYLLGLTWNIPATPATSYLTLILKSLDFGTFTTNLLTIPAYCLFFAQLIFLTWLSERINNRFLIIFFCQVYMLPLLVALEVLPGGAAYNWPRYALNAMLVGYPYVHAIIGMYPQLPQLPSKDIHTQH